MHYVHENVMNHLKNAARATASDESGGGGSVNATSDDNSVRDDMSPFQDAVNILSIVSARHSRLSQSLSANEGCSLLHRRYHDLFNDRKGTS